MQFVVPEIVDIVPVLLLLAGALGMMVVRGRDLLAPAIRAPGRLLQWLLWIGAALSLVEAVTELPVFEVLQTLRNLLNYEFTKIGDAPITPITIGTGVAIVIGPTVGTYVLNNWALSRAESSQVALFIYLQFLIASPISAIFLDDPVGWELIPAVALVFAGVAFSVTARRRRP